MAGTPYKEGLEKKERQAGRPGTSEADNLIHARNLQGKPREVNFILQITKEFSEKFEAGKRAEMCI